MSKVEMIAERWAEDEDACNCPQCMDVVHVPTVRWFARAIARELGLTQEYVDRVPTEYGPAIARAHDTLQALLDMGDTP